MHDCLSGMTGGYMEKIGKKPVGHGRLIYENKLACAQDIENFRLEGSAWITFPNGRMRMENAKEPSLGQKANYVLWCMEVFPEDIWIEWDFYPLREPGLCMMFFAAKGRQGEDLFDGNLAERTGEYPQYHHGDIDAFHVSYFRRKEPDERAFHTCNLRKSYGFHLVAQGADPIPDAGETGDAYRIAVLHRRGGVTFFINGLEIFHFADDGVTYGPRLGAGRIGFRQLAPMVGEYANLKVYAIKEDENEENVL